MQGPNGGCGSVSGRYRVEERVGRGGTAEVFRVRDTSTGVERALKRLQRVDGPLRARAEALFAQEYQLLSELSHPHVVSVYDYGVDEDGPYYVMDLMTGPSLQQRAPMPWADACRILHDLTTSLALLHARRLVHCDVSPANVCLDEAGRAKLLDFGAMVPFGPSSHTVGTPPFIAPEMVHGQRLDARSDLYSLGALAYYLVTGRNAYAARDFRDLRDLWRSRPTAPGRLVADLPPALEQLISALLSLDPAGRPASAAEVLQRLRVIASLPPHDGDYAQSFLTTPAILGRDEARTSFRKRMLRALRGRGGSLLVRGPAGSGRSRLLESHVLEGKLVGALVLRADASSCGSAPFATMLALLLQCREAAPDLFEEIVAPHVPILGHVSSVLQPVDEDPYDLVDPVDDAALRRSIHRSLMRVFGGLARYTCLLVVVDDVDMCDEASAAVLTELASAGRGGRMVLVTSALDDDGDASPAGPARPTSPAVAQLAELGARIALRPLTEDQTRALLRGVFGPSASLQRLSEWAFTLSMGNPGKIMELAQYLVDSGMAHLQDGSWRLPRDVAALQLPASFDETIEHELRSIGAGTLRAGQLIALSEPGFPLSVQHLQALSPRDGPPLLGELERLRTCGVLLHAGGHYRFRSAAHRRIALGLLDDDQLAALHASLADAHDACEDGHGIVAHHLRLSGQDDAAFKRLSLLGFDRSEFQSLSPGTLFFRSPAGIALVRFGLAYALRTGRSRERVYHFRSALLGLSFADPSLCEGVEEVLQQLRHDVGLVYAAELPAELDQSQRVAAMLERAQAAYDGAPRGERCLSPVAALFELATTVIALCATHARTWRVADIPALQEIVAPFATLSPAMALVHDTARMCVMGCLRGDDTRALRAELHAATAKPVEGMEEPARQTAHLTLAFYLGIDEAMAGSVRALEFADTLERAPGHGSLAAEVRLLFYLAQGDFDRVREVQQRRDLYALQEQHQQQLALGPLWEAGLHFRTGDLMAVRALVPQLHAEAARFPGWRPWYLLAEGMYQLLHQDFRRAGEIAAEGLALTAPGEHAAWLQLIVIAIEAALGRGDHAAALAHTRTADEAVARLQLTPAEPAGLAAQGALALAHSGHFDEAIARVEAATIAYRGRRSSGVQPSLLHEARARIALLQHDAPAFEEAARRVATEYRPGQHPGLLARYERLMNDAARASQTVSPELLRAAELDDDEAVLTRPTFATTLQTLLGQCQGPSDRALTALELLLERTGTDAGYLFIGTSDDEPMLAARMHAQPPSPALRDEVAAFYRRATDGGDGDGPDEGQRMDAGNYVPYLLWSRREGKVYVTGVAALSGGARAVDVPWELLSALSDALLDAGDAIAAALP